MKPLIVFGRRLTDYLDKISDSITTFRTILYILIFYVLTAVAFSFSGGVPYSASMILESVVWLLIVCKLLNLTFSKIFKVPISHESDLITALILALILSPAKSLDEFLVLAAAALVAMLGKYIFSYNGRHIFNPAALGAVVSSLLFQHYASWWISTSHMAIFLLVGGFLIVRKMRRFSMVLVFALIYIAYRLFLGHLLFNTSSVSLHSLYIDLTITPILFLAPIMLTEPLTSPNRLNNGLIYALVVAIFYSVSKFHRSPEEALLIGNIVAFIIEPNRSILLKLTEKRKEAVDIYSYVFKATKKLSFASGQYLEWTLPGVGVDARGNRRYLTISSAPTEKDLMFTVKTPPNMSKFKQRLSRLELGEQIVATRLAGDFTLPNDTSQKIAFIAGGVGITPFRSMIKDVIDSAKPRDIALFYSVNQTTEIAFKNLFDKASQSFLKTFYILTKEKSPGYLNGYINSEMIAQNLPDYKSRLFYISGPQAFVAAVRISLIKVGVEAKNITTDFFPGYN